MLNTKAAWAILKNDLLWPSLDNKNNSDNYLVGEIRGVWLSYTAPIRALGALFNPSPK